MNQKNIKVPEVSIIIPVYNCGEKILNIINSIQNQPFSNWELIIINDKSTDNTKDILSKLYDKKIKVINLPKNFGPSEARNRGINESTGKYLLFFDADDDIYPDSITNLVKNMHNGNQIIIGGFTLQQFKKGTLIKSTNYCLNEPPARKSHEPFKLYITRLLGIDGRLYSVWNKIYLASIIRENNIRFPININFGEDLMFNLEYFSKINHKISFITQPIYYYKQNLDQGTFSKSSLVYKNKIINYNKLIKFLADVPSSIKKDSLLSWINYRWLYSHIISINNSDLNFSEKIKKIKEARYLFKPTIIGKKSIIGGKNYIAEIIIKNIIKLPILALLFVKTINLLKKIY